MALALVEYQSGAAREPVQLVVHSKFTPATGQYRNLVWYGAPARDQGKLVLFNASNMWFYDPASKASIRISPAQRLVGQASDGDVLTVNLGHDYTAKLLGAETIPDADKVTRDSWHLELTAATPEAAYSRLEYWVEKGTSRPVKVRFYSDSGRLLKLAYYRKFETAMGVTRPMETIIVDAVDSHLVTKITGSDMRSEAVQDAWFQRDYLPQFSEP
jgi:hypothetical protein